MCRPHCILVRNSVDAVTETAVFHRKFSRAIDKTRALSVFNSFIKTPTMVFLICSYWSMYCDLKLPLHFKAFKEKRISSTKSERI